MGSREQTEVELDDELDPKFVIKNLDTGSEMRIDDFERLASIASNASDSQTTHPKKGGLPKGTKALMKNWGAGLAKTAKKAVSGIKDLPHLPHELSIPQMRVKPRDLLLADMSPGSHTSSLEGGTSQTSVTGSEQQQQRVHSPEVLDCGCGVVWCLAFSRDGSFLAAAGQDGLLRVWQTSTSRSVGEGHGEDIVDLSWSAGGFLLTASLDKSVRLWHISQPGCLRKYWHTDIVTGVQFHPVDAQRFVSGCIDGKIRVWSITDSSVLAHIQVHQDMVSAVSWSLTGSRVMVGTTRGRVRFYELVGRKLEHVALVDVRNQRGQHAGGKKVTGISAVPAQPNQFLITTNDSRLRLLDGYGTALKFKGHKNSNTQIRATVSSDGRHVLCGSDDGWVYVWQYGVGAAAGSGVGAHGPGQRQQQQHLNRGAGVDKRRSAASVEPMQLLHGKNAVFQAFQSLEPGVPVTAVACAPAAAFSRSSSVLLSAPPDLGGGGAIGEVVSDSGAEALHKVRQALSASSSKVVRQLVVSGGFTGGIRLYELLG
eukprot:gene8700-8881_t